jgi:hypothetical protein
VLIRRPENELAGRVEGREDRGKNGDEDNGRQNEQRSDSQFVAHEPPQHYLILVDFFGHRLRSSQINRSGYC